MFVKIENIYVNPSKVLYVQPYNFDVFDDNPKTQQHKSTLVFVNNTKLATNYAPDALAAMLNVAMGE